MLDFALKFLFAFLNSQHKHTLVQNWSSLCFTATVAVLDLATLLDATQTEPKLARQAVCTINRSLYFGVYEISSVPLTPQFQNQVSLLTDMS
jgi:hypothetical protein